MPTRVFVVEAENCNLEAANQNSVERQKSEALEQVSLVLTLWKKS